MHVLCPQCRNSIEVVNLTPHEEITCSACDSSFRLDNSWPTTTTGQAEQQRLGKYQLLGVVGHGAFGIVYKARDPELDRFVAVKVARAGSQPGPGGLERFYREARSVAQLRHPSIVSMHEVGTAEGVPYLVSDFVEGVTLSDRLTGKKVGLREAAELLAAVADALQYAHEQGVVHRDVKPSNIMLGADGKPFIMDFGLARRDAGEVTMTLEGQVLGTPAYMPPEQARGEGHAVDGRGDVYSLGVVLYQLLTGELPFRGNTRMLLHQVLHDEPRPPHRLNDHVPRDVQTICLKAMAKEPGRRYQSARELADDLRRWLKGEPILARPAGRVERATRWVRRHPARAALVGVSGVALLALVGLSVGLVYHGQLTEAYHAEEQARLAEGEQRAIAEEARRGEEQQRKRAEAALAEAERVGYFHAVFLADLALKEDAVALARQHLLGCKKELRNWEWRYLYGQCHPEVFSAPGLSAAFSPDGARIAVAPAEHGGREVKVYDAWTGEAALTLEASTPLWLPMFSSDGARIAVLPRNHADGVRMYDARSGKEVFSLSRPGGVFTPDGSRLVTWNRGDGLWLYDARTGQHAFTIDKPLKGLLNPTFSPDGARLAAWGKDRLHVFDARTGAHTCTLEGPVEICSPTFSPDGSRLAAWEVDGPVRLHDTTTGKRAVVLGGPTPYINVMFTPDGVRVLVRGDDHRLRLYDARTGKEALTLKGRATGVGDPVISPDGTLVAVESAGVIRLHDARTGEVSLSLRGPSRLSYPRFSPDGSRLAVSSDRVVRVYDVRTDRAPPAPRKLDTSDRLTFSPEGGRIAALAPNGDLRVYNSRTGEERFSVKGVAVKGVPRDSSPRFSPDGDHLVVVEDKDVARVYETRTGKAISSVSGPAKVAYPAFSRDGSRVVVSDTPGVVRVHDIRANKVISTIRTGFESRVMVSFSRDGARLGVASGDWKNRSGAVGIFDVQTGARALSLEGSSLAHRPVFSPDGSLIAVPALLDGAGVVRTHDGRTGEVFVLIRSGIPGALSVVFSPDGHRIAVLGQNNYNNEGVVRVFDARTGALACTLQGAAQIRDLVFSPDGSRIALLSGEMLRLYDAHTGQEALKVPVGPLSRVGSPVFSLDGSRITLPRESGPLVLEAPADIPAWQAARRKALADGLPAWHRAKAAEYEKAGLSFAAAFHRDRLASRPSGRK